MLAQPGAKGDWSMTGGDPGQNGWQKAEAGLKPDDIAESFKFLWKIKLGTPSKVSPSFSEPLLASRLINAQGFKDMVYWGSSDTLYAVDSELGNLLWKKSYSGTRANSVSCASNLGIVIEPPPVINFNARRRPAGTPPPPEPPPTAPGARRLGVAPGGGYFGLKGIYVLTNDGMLHEQVLTTGADFAPPVKFLAGSGASGLNITGKNIYASTGRNCSHDPNGAWAMDIASADYPVASYTTKKLPTLSITGPVIGSDGTSFIVTGGGNAGPSPDAHPNSIIALNKEIKAVDWYTPMKGTDSFEGVTPITVSYKGKQFLVAPDRDGSIVLLDTTSLGGQDHHTPLFKTSSLSKPGQKHRWDGLASWQDKDGATWVFASISAAVSIAETSAKQNGTSLHGAVVALKLDDAADGKLTLTPAWVSRDMVNPAPPRIANGVVIALAGGNPATHAVLYVLNAATGEELYSSKDEIPTYTHLSGVAVGDSHAFFTDHNSVLYSFGIGMEH
jgi:outer membrane protein assembly factor BamB